MLKFSDLENSDEFGDCNFIWNKNMKGPNIVGKERIGYGWSKNAYEVNGQTLQVLNLKGKTVFLTM